MISFATIETAIQELQQGRMILLVDDEHREQEGDLIIAAEKVTPESINFMTKYARGLICLTLTAETIENLNIPLMPERNKLPNQASFTVSIESAKGVTTGVSAHDRAHTIKVAIDTKSVPNDISMPGHIFPLRARDKGVLERPGHTEGSVDLARLAGLHPSAVICEIMNDDGSMARQANLVEFAKLHNIKIVAINDLIDYRLKNESIVEEIASADLPLKVDKNFQIKVFRDVTDNTEHLALISKKASIHSSPLVRIHSQCLTGDVFGSQRCDCGEQLKTSLERISQEGGVLIYMQQEGRGIGLANKIKAYSLQSQGMDTVEANLHLGFSADTRNYALGAQVLKALGIKQIRLLTNNPKKIADMERYGIEVTQRVAHETIPTEINIQYLKTKRDKLNHLLELKEIV